MRNVKEQERLFDCWQKIAEGLETLREFEPENAEELRGKAFAYSLGCEYLLPVPAPREQALKDVHERITYIQERLEKYASDEKWGPYFSAHLEILEKIILPKLEEIV